MGDPIADMLNRIMNAQAVKKETVEVPFSQQKYAIAKILEKNGFVKHADFRGKRVNKAIEVSLRYVQGVPRIAGVKRISKPGQRMYVSVPEIRSVKSGRGIAIISTSKGFMSSGDAKKENTGGEILCEIW